MTLKFTHLKDRVINHLYSSQDYLGVYTGIFFQVLYKPLPNVSYIYTDFIAGLLKAKQNRLGFS